MHNTSALRMHRRMRQVQVSHEDWILAVKANSGAVVLIQSKNVPTGP
jgi:hypothetical protein